MVPVKSHSAFAMLHRFSKAVLLFVFSAAFVTTRPIDDPATQLKRNFESAKSALSAGDLSEAERRYNQVIALGLRQLGNLSASESRFDEATRELDEALKFAPGDPDITVDAAIAWFRAGEVQKARQLAQTVAHGNPRNARAQNVLGRIDLYRGDFPDAIGDLQAAIALDDDFETSYFLGIAYLRAKHFTDAQQWFKHLQDTMGDSAALHVLFGRAYSIGHFPESAVAEFRKAIQLDPKYPHAHGLLGYSILEFRGEEVYPQARLERDPEEVPRDVSRAYYLLGQALRRLGRLEEAQKALVNSQHYREAKFRYDAQHIFDEPAVPSDGDSHTSDRIAGLLESGAHDQVKSTEAMVQGGMQENPAVQQTRAAQQAVVEPKEAKQYRTFASEIL